MKFKYKAGPTQKRAMGRGVKFHWTFRMYHESNPFYSSEQMINWLKSDPKARLVVQFADGTRTEQEIVRE